MAATQQPQVDFVKAISRLDATALVVGSMIGSGIFIVSPEIPRQVHSPGLLAGSSVALLTWINMRGGRAAALIQTSLTAVKTAALAALILLGLTIGRHADAIAANLGGNFWATGGVAVGLGAIGAAMVGSLFSMDAWNNVGFAGSGLDHPQRGLPVAVGARGLIVTAT